jgi:hypothetical protein
MPQPPCLPATEAVAEGGGIDVTAAHAATVEADTPSAKRLCAVARLLLMAGARVGEVCVCVARPEREGTWRTHTGGGNALAFEPPPRQPGDPIPVEYHTVLC